MVTTQKLPTVFLGNKSQYRTYHLCSVILKQKGMFGTQGRRNVGIIIPIVNTKLLSGYHFVSYMVLPNYYLIITTLLPCYYPAVT